MKNYVYSLENFNSLLQQKKKIKRTTYSILSACLVAIVLILFLSFKFNLKYLSILGGAISIFAFIFFYLRKDLIHKKITQYIEFYGDIVYGEKSTDCVLFLREGEDTFTGKYLLKSIYVYSFKQECEIKLLFDSQGIVSMQEDKKYLITVISNMIIEYEDYLGE